MENKTKERKDWSGEELMKYCIQQWFLPYCLETGEIKIYLAMRPRDSELGEYSTDQEYKLRIMDHATNPRYWVDAEKMVEDLWPEEPEFQKTVIDVFNIEDWPLKQEDLGVMDLYDLMNRLEITDFPEPELEENMGEPGTPYYAISKKEFNEYNDREVTLVPIKVNGKLGLQITLVQSYEYRD